MSTPTDQPTQSTERIVMGCLFTFSEPNGLIEIPLTDAVDGFFSLTRASRYFRDIADIERYRIRISSEEFDEPSIMHVLYDKKLHGTPKCPYLVIRVTYGGQTVDLKRKDYMAATKAVEQVLRMVAPYKEK
ncbi:hypothetical protein DFJ58DRAFT_733924 [Suillus subalutaceus]|uniref:uncharacterized protein n=1 Tax=Suillus subalutaceus TaxID=48586 RepID=UPI001B86204F|nr:uncharacterized protein DFJ58DRAFT_733924 [Suillus subalutaceus]KAG1838186.1 hypothetical protein DFJ58DRAFT_733924 [Suillus subalutaceus]